MFFINTDFKLSLKPIMLKHWVSEQPFSFLDSSSLIAVACVDSNHLSLWVNQSSLSQPVLVAH